MDLDLQGVKIEGDILNLVLSPPLMIEMGDQTSKVRKLARALMRVLGYMAPSARPMIIDFEGDHQVSVTTWHDDIVIEVVRPNGAKDAIHLVNHDAHRLALGLIGFVETIDPR